jgi:hypothetical protein
MVSLVSGSKNKIDVGHDYIVVDEVATGANSLTVVIKDKYKDEIENIRTGSLTIGKWYILNNKNAQYVSFRFSTSQKKIIFINCHLNPHAHGREKRQE